MPVSSGWRTFAARVQPVLERAGILNRYLFMQAVPPFTISLTVVLLALLLERLLVLFDLLTVGNSPLLMFMGMLADLIPHYMGLALPAAFCVSVFAVMRRMSQDNEIDAIMAAGVSFIEIVRPFFITGFVLGLLSLVLYGYVQPYARYDFRAAYYIASHAGWVPKLQGGMFTSPSRRISVTVDRVDAANRLHGVFIRETMASPSGGKKGPVERDIVARYGRMKLSPDQSFLVIDLYNGQVLTHRKQGEPSSTWFEHSVKIISTAGKIPAFRPRGHDERELTLWELRKALHKGDTAIGRPHLRSEFHFRLARAFSMPFISVLAASLALVAKRQRQSLKLALAALILVGYDHMLQFGAGLTATGRHAPWLPIWGPFMLFCLVCLGLVMQQSWCFARWKGPRKNSKTGQTS